ncbi:MAG: NADH-quinone oxidoreductase subunit NuoK [Deltaproteobacteria bacterium]|nr:MAG: NADH-quinone oxidoreductase subunit NuoK [Deltaproteobacteria bacterium]
MTVGLYHYLFVAAILFVLGIVAMMTRRNSIAVLMGVELILNAANINFIAFSHYGQGGLDGQMAAIFVIITAAAEVTVAIGIVFNIYRNWHSIDLAKISRLKD